MSVPMGLRPTKMHENPLELASGYDDYVTGRRDRRRSGVLETECLSDPERAYVPMIVRRRSRSRELVIARDAACWKLSWHALRSRAGG